MKSETKFEIEENKMRSVTEMKFVMMFIHSLFGNMKEKSDF